MAVWINQEIVFCCIVVQITHYVYSQQILSSWELRIIQLNKPKLSKTSAQCVLPPYH